MSPEPPLSFNSGRDIPIKAMPIFSALRRFGFRYTSRWRNLSYHFRSAEWTTLRAYQQGKDGTARLPWLALLRSSWESALRVPKVRSVGWDIAVRPDGPCLIEGNNNWNAQVVQIPANTGLRHLADAVCDMYQVYD